MSYIKLLKFQNGFPKEMDASTDSLALQEIKLGGDAGTALTKAILDTLTGGTSSDATSLHSHDTRYYTKSEVDSAIQSMGEAADSADEISFAPAGTIEATNVQAAIEEVASDAASSLSSETSARQAADTALSGRLDTLEGQNLDTRLTAAEGDIGQLQTDVAAAQSAADDAQAAADAAQSEVDALETYVDATFIPLSQKGQINGVAELGADGKVPAAQLPSYVDDVLEFANLAAFPGSGEAGKIYVALDTNKTYRWSGSAYIYITSGAVDSVNGQTGVVTLDSDDVSEGSANLYFTGQRAKDAVAADISSAVADETSARIAADEALEDEDLTFLKLDGSRAMSGALDMDGNNVGKVASLIGTATDSLLIKAGANQGFNIETGDGETGLWVGNDGYATIWGNAAAEVGGSGGAAIYSDSSNSPGSNVTRVTAMNGGTVKINAADHSGATSKLLIEGAETKISSALISVESQKIQNLAAGTVSTDAVNKSQMDAAAAAAQAAAIAAAANKTLSNLTGPTAINQDLIPESNSRTLGSFSTRWGGLFSKGPIYGQNLLITDGSNNIRGQIVEETQSLSGVNHTGLYVQTYSGTTTPLLMTTGGSGTANSTKTGDIVIHSGDKVAGTGNSGDIKLKTGTSAGGIRGKVILDGSEIDASSKKITNLSSGSATGDAINKGQLDSAQAALQSQISAATSSLSWKPAASTITADAGLAAAADGTALSTLLPFSDDDLPTQLAIGDFAAGDFIVSANGASSKMFLVVDDAGTLKVQAATLEAGDTMTVRNDLLDSPDSQENLAIYHFSGAGMVKIGDVDWSFANGINLTGSYAAAAGSVLPADTVESAISKLDGNIAAEESAREAAITAEENARSAEDLTFLKLDGTRPMAGDLDMAGNDIKKVGDISQDPAASTYFSVKSAQGKAVYIYDDVDEKVSLWLDPVNSNASLYSEGTVDLTGYVVNLNPNTHVEVSNKQIKSLADPTADMDATNKRYVDLINYDRRDAGENIAEGDLVVVKRNGSNAIRVYKASAAAADNADYNDNGAWEVYGIALASATPGQSVLIKKFGEISPAFTGTAPVAADVGKSVYLSATAGKAVVGTPPASAGDAVVYLGRVTIIGSAPGIDFRFAHLRAVNS